jgi:aminoglycoside/choline kinase family phosphotransferase
MSDRDGARTKFILACGWQDAAVEALPQDASFRRYFRLRRDGETRILMDSPSALGQDVGPFIAIDRHMIRLGLSAPQIYNIDEGNGFLLIEDFGDSTFTRLLAAGHDETELYALAVDSLIQLQSSPQVLDVNTTSYMNRFVPQAEWLLQWYYKDAKGAPAGEECERLFYDAWYRALNAMPNYQPTLMLRDYHVDNLILLQGRQGVAACGLLDFQDAEFAPRPYDLVCLLEDARRDVPDDLRDAMLARYGAVLPIDDDFHAWYAVIAAQRHMRVIGNFVRLAVRDNKPAYRVHIPRVQRYLNRSLANPALAPVAEWSQRWLGGFQA